MSQENVEVVRQSIDAFNRRDVKALRMFDDPDLEVDWSASRGVAAGVYRGIDAVLQFYGESFDVFDEIILEPDRFIEAGESVVVPNRSRSRGRDGIELFTRSALVFTVRGRRIVRICLYQDADQALADLGLEG